MNSITKLWTAHLSDPKDIEHFQRLLNNSSTVFDRLKDILNTKDEAMDNVETSLGAYDNPNWPYRQAHINGYRSCLKRLDKILTLDPKEDKND